MSVTRYDCLAKLCVWSFSLLYYRWFLFHIRIEELFVLRKPISLVILSSQRYMYIHNLFVQVSYCVKIKFFCYIPTLIIFYPTLAENEILCLMLIFLLSFQIYYHSNNHHSTRRYLSVPDSSRYLRSLGLLNLLSISLSFCIL